MRDVPTRISIIISFFASLVFWHLGHVSYMIHIDYSTILLISSIHNCFTCLYICNLHILQFIYVLYMSVFVSYPYHFGLQLLRTMLLLQYLIHVLEGDLLPRNRAYKGKLFLFMLNFLLYPCNFRSLSLISILLLMQKRWTGPF